MSVLVFALVALAAGQARAGERPPCADAAAVEAGSCGGDATSSSSFIQTASHSHPPRGGRRPRRGAPAQGVTTAAAAAATTTATMPATAAAAAAATTTATTTTATAAAAAATAAAPTATTAAGSSASQGTPATIGRDFCRPDAGAHLRVRKNIFDMAKPQWDSFKAAWRSLYSQGLYRRFAVEHTMHYRDDPEEGHFRDHGGAFGFLAFHRGQIQDLETELMQEAGDCEMAFPFWDWSLDVSSFASSEIWSGEYMGDGQGCVMTGLPGGWTYDAPELHLDDPCVERHVRGRNGLYDSRRIALMLANTPDFENFVHDLEGIHNTVHGVIGGGRTGNMASKVGMASPSDPMFYLHHAFIDSVYFRWQTLYDDTSATLLRERLQPLVGRYDTDQDCVYLPIHRSLADDAEATCVRYQAAENAHPQDSLLLQAFAGDSTCKALQQQIQRGECSFQELRDLVCIAAPECLLSEDVEFEESREFDTDPDTEEVFEKTLHKLTGELACHRYSADFTSAERHHCYKCDVKCVDR